MLSKVKSLFEGEVMQTQYSVLGYNIAFFHNYKFAIEMHESGYSDGNIDRKKDKKQQSKNFVVSLLKLIQ